MLFIKILLLVFLSVSHGASQFSQQPNIQQTQVMPEESERQGLVSWEAWRRSAMEDGESFNGENQSMILAAERTRRKDPSEHLRYYEGGWNISEKHYFFSVAYTAAPLFIIAVLWFVGFAVTLSVLCIRHCCFQLKNYGYSRTLYALSLVFIIFFTVAAITGSIVLYAGEEKFNGSTTTTLDYVVTQADSTVENLTTVSEYLASAKNIGIDQIFLPPSVQDSINKVEKMINASSSTLQDETIKNKDSIEDALYSIRVTLITVAAVMLFFAFLGFVLSIFGMQFAVYILTIIGWILATAALVLCCLFLILHNVVGDSCVAMDEWVENPTAHTALDDILPCVDTATARETLLQTKQVTFQLVGVVNFFITNISNRDPPPPNLPPNTKLFYNQSGPLVPVLCNPLNADLTDRKCSAGEVVLNEASQEWSKYICRVSEAGICTTTGRLTPDFYAQMVSAANVGYALHYYSPFLVELVDCTFVRETFGDISRNHCPGLKRYSKWVVIGLEMVSAAAMFSLIFWVFYARERRHRVYSQQFLKMSTPNNPVTEEHSKSQHS